jgi:hypothetical protein
MFSCPPVQFGDGLVLWIELFDHNIRASIDSCSCREIEDALAAFDSLVAQAENRRSCRRTGNR